MSYGRDRDAHTRGVGAVAAADHLRARKARKRLMVRSTARRDAQLAGLTYGPRGGLAGYGALEQLGAISVTGSSMQSIRQPTINPGGFPEGPQPPPQRTFNPLAPRTGIVGPTTFPGSPGVVVPPLRAFPAGRAGAAAAGVSFPVVTSIGPIGPGGGVTGTWGTSGGASSGGGSSSGGSTNVGTGVSTGGGYTGPSDGAGGGIVTGGSSGPALTPPPDVPNAPADDSSISIAGVNVSKKAVLIGGGLLAAYLVFGRKR